MIFHSKNIKMIIAALGTGLVAGKVNKAKERKQKDKVTGNYQNDFPISNDCDELDNTIKAAEFELIKVQNEPDNTKGSKRNKDRALTILSKWVQTLKNYRKDVKCEMATKVPLNQTTPQITSTLSTNINSGMNNNSQALTDNSSAIDSQLAGSENEKKSNNLLYFGIAGAVLVVLYFVFKKK